MALKFPWTKDKEEPIVEETEEDMDNEYLYEQIKEKARTTPKFIDTSKKREYLVGHTTDSKTGRYLCFFVTDVFDDAELQSGARPELARFPVSELYDAYEQKQRAEKYCEYMNRMLEAKQKVYEQTLLVDILKENV